MRRIISAYSATALQLLREKLEAGGVVMLSRAIEPNDHKAEIEVEIETEARSFQPSASVSTVLQTVGRKCRGR